MIHFIIRSFAVFLCVISLQFLKVFCEAQSERVLDQASFETIPSDGQWPVFTKNGWEENIDSENLLADDYFDYSARLKSALAVPQEPPVMQASDSSSAEQKNSTPQSFAEKNTESIYPAIDKPIEEIIPPLPQVPVDEAQTSANSSMQAQSLASQNAILPDAKTKTSQLESLKQVQSASESISQPKASLPTLSNSVAISPSKPSLDEKQTLSKTLQSSAHSDGVVISEQTKGSKEVSINFNNLAMVEYIHFISQLSNKNFIFDDEDLQFAVTIISEEPTTVDNLMAALLQELKIRDLSLMEQGNNIIIHRNPRIRAPSRIVMDGTAPTSSYDSELVTRVFRLNTLDPVKASDIIRPLLSDDALVEVLKDTNNLIITDLVNTVNKIAQLINTLDAPNSGMSIGQYLVHNTYVESLVDLGTKILQPIAQGNPFILVPHAASNSIFIVANSFLVEKALAILQNLDLNEGRTKIMSLETLQPSYVPLLQRGKEDGIGRGQGYGGGANSLDGRPGELDIGRQINPSELQLEAQRKAILNEREFSNGETGNGFVNDKRFMPAAIGAEGRQSSIFSENQEFLPGGVGVNSRYARELPVGHIERTLFFIYKLRYRKGDSIEIALRKIAASLIASGTANADLISAINSSQWIESSNALIFTGIASALEKIRELILEIDVPLRQVFIEMLILDTTINDSLTYSVDWINRFGGGSTTGEEGFIQPARPAGTSNFYGVIDPTVQAASNAAASNTIIDPVTSLGLPIATGFLGAGGFAAGVIGTHLTHNGTCFSSIGALVRAIHTDQKANILLNPKIITEDNNPAEIFVGGTDRYKTQSLSNDLGSVITNNFQFIDVGTTLRVTPLIGNNGIITLEITQESTAATAGANDPALATNQDVNLVPVLTKTRSVTKIHVPNGFFVIFSGMIMDNETRSYSRIPCLGGIPIIGSFGKAQSNTDAKRNLMLFIRPLIIDTDEEFEDVTRRQQEVYREKSKFRRSWNYELDEGMNFLNIRSTDPDETCVRQGG